MQMNMNMVMVGRQIEQLKRDKQRIKAKLLAMKKASAKLNYKTLTKPWPQAQKPENSQSWASKVKGELTEMLRDIPSNVKEGGEAKNSSLGSLWDFKNVLDRILHRQARSSNTDQHYCEVTTNAIYLGLTFIDFWLTSISTIDTNVCQLQFEFCLLAVENGRITNGSQTLQIIEQRLAQGASFYLSQFHKIPRLTYTRMDDCDSLCL